MALPVVPDWLDDFGFERLDRSRFRFESLNFESETAWAEKLAVEITTELKVRIREKGRLGVPAPLQWLKPVCYNAILTCLYHDLFGELEARIERYGRLVRGPAVERSIFSIGIMAIFAHDVPKGRLERNAPRPLTDEKGRKRMADEMWWAFRHYAEPAELAEFNRKYPLHRKRPPPPEGYLLPEFHDQIIERRFAFSDFVFEEVRGAYPDAVEDEVEKRQLNADNERRAMAQRRDYNW